jgi:hypothetical protein
LGYLLEKNIRGVIALISFRLPWMDAAVSCRSEACYPSGWTHGRSWAVKRRAFITLVGGAAVWPLAARAQQSKTARVGALYIGTADAESFKKELRGGLRELGI